MTINPAHINTAATHADSMPVARRIIDAQQRADLDGAHVIESHPAAVLEISAAIRLDMENADGGLVHVYRAASLAGVPRSAGLAAYHRMLTGDLADAVYRSTVDAAADEAAARINFAAAAADYIRDVSTGIHAEAIGEKVRIVNTNTGTDTTYDTAADAQAAALEILPAARCHTAAWLD